MATVFCVCWLLANCKARGTPPLYLGLDHTPSPLSAGGCNFLVYFNLVPLFALPHQLSWFLDCHRSPCTTATSFCRWIQTLLLHHGFFAEKRQKFFLFVSLCVCVLLALSKLQHSGHSASILQTYRGSSCTKTKIFFPFFVLLDFIRGFLSHFFTCLLWCCQKKDLSLPYLTKSP